MNKKEKYINKILTNAVDKLAIDMKLPPENLQKIFRMYQSDYFYKSLKEWTDIDRVAEHRLGIEDYMVTDLNFLLYQTNDKKLIEICDSDLSGDKQFSMVCSRLSEMYFDNDREYQEKFFDQIVMNNSFENILKLQHGISTDTSIKGRVKVDTCHTYDNKLIDAVKQLEPEHLINAKRIENTVDSLNYLISASPAGKHLSELIIKREIASAFERIRYTKTPQVFTKVYDGKKLAYSFNVDRPNRYSIAEAKTKKSADKMIKSVLERFTADIIDRDFRLKNNLLSINEKMELAKNKINNLMEGQDLELKNNLFSNGKIKGLKKK